MLLLCALFGAALLPAGANAAVSSRALKHDQPGLKSIVHFDTLEDALRYNPLLSTLRKAIDESGLKDKLSDPELVATIVAPTDSAFSRLLKDLKLTEAELFGNKELLSQVLQFHVVPNQALKVDDLYDGEAEETLLPGHSLTFRKESYLYFLTKLTIFSDVAESKPATVQLSDVEAAKLVIHIVNRVLVPSSEEKLFRAANPVSL